MDRIFGPLGLTVRGGWRLVHPGWRAEGTLPPGPAVLLVHHQNLFGPVCAEALLPREPHLWVLQPFTRRQDCRRHYRDYTFSVRCGWPRPLAALAAGACSLVIPPLLSSLGAIPVCRGRREILTTLELSMQVLNRGEQVLLCPDLDYSDGTPVLGPLYTGFLHLEKAWFRRHRTHLPFVPLYCSRKRRQLVIGPAVCFSGTLPFAQERSQIAQTLRDRINAMGIDCGDIPQRPTQP